MSEDTSPGWTSAIAGVAGSLGIVAIWQFVGAAEVFGTSISPPTDVIDVYRGGSDRSLLVRAATATGREALFGFLWAAVVAVIVGGVVVAVPALRRGIDQLATIQSAIPLVALAPILLATVSRDSVPTAMAACTAFFPMYVATVSGLHAAPQVLREVFSVFGASSSQTFRRVRLPSAAPVFATGLKVAMPLAIVGAVIGEWLGVSKGVGPVMLTALRNYKMPMMWAAASATVVVAVVLFFAMATLERVVVRRFGT